MAAKALLRLLEGAAFQWNRRQPVSRTARTRRVRQSRQSPPLKAAKILFAQEERDSATFEPAFAPKSQLFGAAILSATPCFQRLECLFLNFRRFQSGTRPFDDYRKALVGRREVVKNSCDLKWLSAIGRQEREADPASRPSPQRSRGLKFRSAFDAGFGGHGLFFLEDRALA